MTASPVFPDTSAARDRALMIAARLHETNYQEREPGDADRFLLATATKVWRWLSGPAYLVIVPGPVRDRATGEIDPTNPRGNHMSQIKDGQELDLEVYLASKAGNEIGDQPGDADNLVWQVESGEDVVELEVSEDTRTATIRARGPVGSAVVRLTVPDTEPTLTATYAVDVVPGPAATLEIRAGEPRDQEPAGEPTPEG